MPLDVACMVQYLSRRVPNEDMRDADYAGQQIVKAVKGEPPGGRERTVYYYGVGYTFGPKNPQPAVDIWVAWAAERLSFIYGDDPYVLVPVPNSGAVFGTDANFRTAELARRLAASDPKRISVVTHLWWKQAMQSARQGGPRFADELYPHLVVVPTPNDTRPRVLVDDVLTSGGHLRASATRLKEIGYDVEAAFCCGRSCQAQLKDPYRVPLTKLEDYDPLANRFGFTDVSGMPFLNPGAN